MKYRLILVWLAVCLLGTIAAQDVYYTTSSSNKLSIKQYGTTESIVGFSLGGFSKSELSENNVSGAHINAPNSYRLMYKGAPDLPAYSFSYIIPDGKSWNVSVVNSQFTDYHGFDILPSKGNLYRNVNPDDIPYEYGSVYKHDKFFPGTMCETSDPYIIRDYQGQTIRFFPFQYNPVSKILRVYHKIDIAVTESSKTVSGHVRGNVSDALPQNREFQRIYENHFLNYPQIASQKYTPLDENGSMLVICHSPFMAAMQPFVQWKNTIGLPTRMVDVAAIGNTPAAIKNYIQAVYDTTNLAYVLLVGDALQVATNTINAYNSDNGYGYLSGNDSYPELFVGRFSAENISHVSTQVERTINYELMPALQLGLFNRAMGMASQEGPGHNNLYDHEHLRLIRDSLLNYNYIYVSELYEGSQGGLDAPGDPVPAQVSVEMNTGVGLINYTGHGWDQGWGTSGFSNVEVDALVNTKILPFIWSVACVNGNFVGQTCFAEAFLRATHNNEPSGAVAAFMSTINQSWNPPMSGQLEMNNLLTESFSNNIKRTFGGLSINGCMKMNDDYGAGGAEMTDTWTIFGDPSLMVRTDDPDTLNVTHDPTIFTGATSMLVQCGTEGAFVCLTINNEILATGTIQGGSTLLTFQPLSVIDTITVAVTAYNHIPYLGDVLIIPPAGPYVIFSAQTVNDAAGNNNNQADYSETVFLNVQLRNVGINNADSVWAVMSTSSPHITINNAQNVWGDFVPAQQKLLNDAFQITVAANAPDNFSNVMNLTVQDKNANQWASSFILKNYAPLFNAASNLIIDDASGNNNGIADPAETVGISIPLTNNGHAGISNVTASITSLSPYLTITNGNFNCSPFIPGQTQNTNFSVTIDPSTPAETDALIEYSVNAGPYSISMQYTLTIGVLPVLWMRDTTLYVCDTYFFDSHGPDENYVNDENFTATFYPSPAVAPMQSFLKAEFLEFEVEENEWDGGCWDELRVYNGPSVSSPLVGTYCGNNWPPVITSTHPSGALTFKFISDNYIDMGGWKARLSCIHVMGQETHEVIDEFKVTPNPAIGKAVVQFKPQGNSASIKILNSIGALVFSTELITYPGLVQVYEIDLSKFSPGMYYVRIDESLRHTTSKLIILQ